MEKIKNKIGDLLNKWHAKGTPHDKENLWRALSLTLYELLSVNQKELASAQIDEKKFIEKKIKINIEQFNNFHHRIKKFGQQLQIQFARLNFENFFLPDIDLSFADCSYSNFLSAKLSKAQFEGAICNNAVFNSANCTGANFLLAHCNHASFLHSILTDAQFPSAKLNGCDMTNAICKKTNFGESFMEGVRLWHTDLSGADLQYASMQNARFYSNTIISGAVINRLQVEGSTLITLKENFLNEEFVINTDSENNYKARAEVYSNLKRYFHTEHDYQVAGHFFIKEREALRQYLKESISGNRTNLKKWLFESFLYHVGKYGEKPSEVLSFAFSLILIFSCTYALSDFFLDTLSISIPDSWFNPLEYIYFSVVTFTTLGFGDIQPAHWLTQILAATEAAFGAFLIAYFVVLWARKIQP